ARGIFFDVIGDELIDAIGKADHFVGNVVDERGTVNATCIEIFEKRFRRATELGDLLVIRPLAFHQLKRARLEHLKRLDVDVAVSDHRWTVVSGQLSVVRRSRTARRVNTRIISRRYSGVSAEVVRGFAVRAARSPAASAIFSPEEPFAMSFSVPFTSIGAGFTAVMPTRRSSMWPLDFLIATATPARG